jgi:hypothetical protein
MNPQLIAALLDDRRRSCPCGARTDQHFSLCRKCQARATWRRHHQRSPRLARRAAVRLSRHAVRFIGLALGGGR